MIEPFGDNVLIREIKPDERTAGGIVLPDVAQREMEQGEVIAVGRGRLIGGELVAPQAEPGDHIIYKKFAGKKVKHEGEEYMLMAAGDLLGRIVTQPAVAVRL